MMTPVIITVIGGTILTPIMLKLVFRGGEKKLPELQPSPLVDHYNESEQLDILGDRLLDKNRALMNRPDDEKK